MYISKALSSANSKDQMNELYDFIYANSQKQIIAFDIWLLSQIEPDGPVQPLRMSRAGRNYLAAC